MNANDTIAVDAGVQLYTIHDVTALLNTVVAGIRTGDHSDDRVYLLPEVAEKTKFSLKALQTDCQKGRVEHTCKGRTVGMTSRQIALLIQKHARGGDLAVSRTSQDDEVAAARRASQKSSQRASRTRTAA